MTLDGRAYVFVVFLRFVSRVLFGLFVLIRHISSSSDGSQSQYNQGNLYSKG